MKKTVLVIYCIVCFLNNSFGIDTLKIGEDFLHKSIFEFGYLHKSTDLTLSIDSIQHLNTEQFEPFSQTGIGFPPQNQIYWLTSILKNETDSIIEVIFEIRNPAINYIQFFKKEGTTLTTFELSGAYRPFKSRLINHRNALVSITIPKQSTVQLYTFLNQQGAQIYIDAHLWDANHFYDYDKTTTFYWAIYFGLIFCFCLLSMIISILVRTQLLIYFTIYCFSLLTGLLYLQGFGFQYIWFNFPNVNYTIGYSCLMILVLSLLGMTRSFLETAKYLSSVDKIIVFFSSILLAFIPVIVLNHNIPIWLTHILYYVGQFLQIAVVFIIISASVLTYNKNKDKSSLGFLFSFFFVLLSIMTLVTRNNSIQDDNFLSTYGIYLGWLLDIFMFTTLIGFRLRRNYLRITQLKQELTQSQLTAANALLNGQMEERQRLSQELHEGISIKMALLKMKIARFLDENSTQGEHILTDVSNISSDIRIFTHAIAPLELKNQTISDVIEDLTYDVEEQTGIAFRVDNHSFTESSLTYNYKHTIYQVLKELINNTIKHSEANEIKITLQSLENKHQIIFEDNGKGFNTKDIKQGIGLSNIQNRAKLLQGEFIIQSNKNGSRFDFLFPIHNQLN